MSKVNPLGVLCTIDCLPMPRKPLRRWAPEGGGGSWRVASSAPVYLGRVRGTQLGVAAPQVNLTDVRAGARGK